MIIMYPVAKLDKTGTAHDKIRSDIELKIKIKLNANVEICQY